MAEGKTEQYAKAFYSIHRAGLGPWARWVYTVLLDEARGSETVSIGLRRVARTLKTTRATVSRAVLELEDHKLLKSSQPKRGERSSFRLLEPSIQSGIAAAPLAPKEVASQSSHRVASQRCQGGIAAAPLAPKEVASQSSHRVASQRCQGGIAAAPLVASQRSHDQTRLSSRLRTRGAAAPSKPRARDPIWDVVVELWYSDGIPKQQRSRVGAWVQALKDLKATPDEIRVRHKRAIEWYERKRATVKAVVEHWSELKNDSSSGISRPGRVEVDGDDFPPAFELSG